MQESDLPVQALPLKGLTLRFISEQSGELLEIGFGGLIIQVDPLLSFKVMGTLYLDGGWIGVLGEKHLLFYWAIGISVPKLIKRFL